MRLVVALLLLMAAVPSPGYEGKDQAKPIHASGQGTTETTSGPQIPSGLKETRAPVAKNEAQKQEGDAAQKLQPFMSHAEWIMSGLTAVYVVLTGFYVWYSRKTLKELQRQIGLIEKQDIATQRQLDISEKTAEAAILSAKSLINAERSWLLIAIQRTTTDPHIFELRVTNHGKSPAEVLWVFMDEVPLEFGDDLPDEPNYGLPNVAFAHRQWIPSGESFNARELDSNMVYAHRADPQIVEDLRTLKKWLWVYGNIRYRDSLSRDIHETRFCYLVNRRTGPMMSGPAGYNDCT